MTMNSSGPISLGGSTAGQSINLENGFSATAQVSLNDTAVRNLAGVPSGTIIMPTNFYGKANRVSISYTFSSNTNNASLNVTSIGGYSAGKSDITITVNSGVYLWSSSTGTAGLTLSGGTSGDVITLVNNGYIMGQGGNGSYSGNSSVPSGGSGGPALSLAYPATINNTNASAYIGGGGGGGGGGWGGSYPIGSGGGGGAGGGSTSNGQYGGTGGGIGSAGNGDTGPSAGLYGGGGGRIFPGSGGAGGRAESSASGGGGAGGGGGQNSQVSGTGNGGNGGSANNSGQSGPVNGASGGGGGWGASGGSGLNQTTNSSVPGGSGGKAVALNGNTVTWTSGNTTRVYGSVS